MAILGIVMAFSMPAGKGTLRITLDHYVGDASMAFDTVEYNNALGQKFILTKFKYYIGNIVLHGADGKSYAMADYFLVNEEEPESKEIMLNNIPEGTYKSVSFLLGVDSAHNCTGLQSGALDPVNAMFWTWNTGYIFLKLEGKAPVSKSPGNIIEYHIGGFRQPANSIRTITLDLTTPLVVTAGNKHTLHLKADALEVLKTPTAIDFSVLSSVTDARNAPIIADNYKDMFSVMGVE